MTSPRVLVGIIANDAARFSLFTACVMQLGYRMGRDSYELAPEILIGGDWCGARNNLARMTLEGDYTHLWFMDDEHAFHDQMLEQLLSHDLPLVSPLCCTTQAPFPLATYAGNEGPLRFLPLGADETPGMGVVELEAGGCAGMLIRRDVLESLEEPWFEYAARSEDVIFCEKAKAAGFTLYADLACRLGHITTAVVYPEIADDRWMTLLSIGGLNVFVDAAEHIVEAEGVEAAEGMSRDDASAYTALPPEVTVAYPCLICGKESVESSPSGMRACADHPGNHEAWNNFYERIEIWYAQEEGRWYARALNLASQIVHTSLSDRSWTQEGPLIGEIERDFPGVTVFHITDELQNSRRNTSSNFSSSTRVPPARLWSREEIS